MNKKLLFIFTFGLLTLSQTTDAWWGRGWGWGGGWGGWGLGFGLGYPYGGWGWGGWGYPYGYGYGYPWGGYYENPEAIRARAAASAQRRTDRDIRDLSTRLARLERQLADAQQDLVEAQQRGDQMRAQRITITINSLRDQVNFTKQRIMSMQQSLTQMETKTIEKLD